MCLHKVAHLAKLTSMENTLELEKFDMKIEARCIFGARRSDVLNQWHIAHKYGSNTETYWAAKLQAVNDAELHYVGGTY